MAKDNSATPEKQLLNLIEEPMSKGSQATALKRHGFGLFSLDALRARFAFLRHRFKGDFGAGEFDPFDIIINNVLKVAIGVLSVYFVFTLAASLKELKKDLKVELRIEREKTAKTPQVVTLLKAVSYYIDKAKDRDIFNMESKKLTSDANVVKGPSSKILDATQDLRLVGISWSADPDVMIEDTKNKRTFFLKKGQLIDNKFRLKAVFKDKVTLSFGGEEIELR